MWIVNITNFTSLVTACMTTAKECIIFAFKIVICQIIAKIQINDLVNYDLMFI